MEREQYLAEAARTTRAAFERYLYDAIDSRQLETPLATDFDRLVSDLAETQAELGWGTLATFDEWLRRIGGWANVPAYARTLTTSDRKMQLLQQAVPSLAPAAAGKPAKPAKTIAVAGALETLETRARKLLADLGALGEAYDNAWVAEALGYASKAAGSLGQARLAAKATGARMRRPPRRRPTALAADYQVIVGNVGHVYGGPDEQTALSTFNAYVEQSKSGVGRAGGEDVTLMRDGEPVREYQGSFECDECGQRITFNEHGQTNDNEHAGSCSQHPAVEQE